MATVNGVYNYEEENRQLQQTLADQSYAFAKTQTQSSIEQMRNVATQKLVDIAAERASNLGKTKDKIQY